MTEKVRAIERIDELIVAPLAAHLATLPQWRMLVCPDHPTFLSTKTHSRGSVPYVMAGTGMLLKRNARFAGIGDALLGAAGYSGYLGYLMNATVKANTPKETGLVIGGQGWDAPALDYPAPMAAAEAEVPSSVDTLGLN